MGLNGRTVSTIAPPHAPQLTLDGVDPLAAFHPAVAEWFRRRFPEGPTAPQAGGWPHIAAGADTLIAAPTGSGKTLAGFLVGIDRALPGARRGRAGRRRRPGRLRVAAQGARRRHRREPRAPAAPRSPTVAAELGPRRARHPGRGAHRRHDRRRSAPRCCATRRASWSPRPSRSTCWSPARAAASALRTVETVIVDEIHAVARDKRGAHLALTLERLEALCDAAAGADRPVGHPAADRDGGAAAGRRPARCPRSSTSATSATSTSRSSCPTASSRRSPRPSRWPTCSTASPRSCGEHRTTLVFVNTRRLAERLAHQLGERLGDDVVAAHHGSLSKERRHRVETRLRAGDLQGAGGHRVARARHRHRPGRAGVPDRLAPQHRHVPAAGRAAPTTPAPARPRAASTRSPATSWSSARRCWRRCAAGRLDAIHPPRLPLDIAAQQVVAEVGARRSGRTDDLFDAGAPGRALHRPHPRRSSTRSSTLVADGHRDRPGPAGRVPPPRRASTASCAAARAPGSPRSRRAAPSPRPATTGWWPSPTTRSSAPSTRTGPSSRWPATSSCSAPTRGRSARSSPGVVRVRDAGDAAAHRSRSGWARRRPAPTSCRPRCPSCAGTSTSSSPPATPTAPGAG